MHQKKHVHNHPYDKNVGKYWYISFDNWGSYKSPLMGWTNGTQDPWNAHTIKFGKA